MPRKPSPARANRVWPRVFRWETTGPLLRRGARGVVECQVEYGGFGGHRDGVRVVVVDCHECDVECDLAAAAASADRDASRIPTNTVGVVMAPAIDIVALLFRDREPRERGSVVVGTTTRQPTSKAR